MITYSQEIARGYVYDDPQPYSLDDLDYFTRKVVDDVKKTEQTLFGISLGDIVGDNLDLQPVYKERMRRLQLPWYNMMGNHDMNYKSAILSSLYPFSDFFAILLRHYVLF